MGASRGLKLLSQGTWSSLGIQKPLTLNPKPQTLQPVPQPQEIGLLGLFKVLASGFLNVFAKELGCLLNPKP